MKTHMNCEACQVTLEEETVSFGGLLLNYQLLVCNGKGARFRVRVAAGEEHMEAELGNQVTSALKLYHAIVRGRVTPCGLPDVMADRT